MACVVCSLLTVAQATAQTGAKGKATKAAAGGQKKVKLRSNNYYYGAFDRRDPFRSLVEGKFVKNDRMSVVELGSVELVGIVKGEMDLFALLEDNKGFSYIIRVGDPVRNGTVIAISDQALVARVTNFGQTSKYTLHLVQRQKAKKE